MPDRAGGRSPPCPAQGCLGPASFQTSTGRQQVYRDSGSRSKPEQKPWSSEGKHPATSETRRGGGEALRKMHLSRGSGPVGCCTHRVPVTGEPSAPHRHRPVLSHGAHPPARGLPPPSEGGGAATRPRPGRPRRPRGSRRPSPAGAGTGRAPRVWQVWAASARGLGRSWGAGAGGRGRGRGAPPLGLSGMGNGRPERRERVPIGHPLTARSLWGGGADLSPHVHRPDPPPPPPYLHPCGCCRPPRCRLLRPAREGTRQLGAAPPHTTGAKALPTVARPARPPPAPGCRRAAPQARRGPRRGPPPGGREAASGRNGGAALLPACLPAGPAAAAAAVSALRGTPRLGWGGAARARQPVRPRLPSAPQGAPRLPSPRRGSPLPCGPVGWAAPFPTATGKRPNPTRQLAELAGELASVQATNAGL